MQRSLLNIQVYIQFCQLRHSLKLAKCLHLVRQTQMYVQIQWGFFVNEYILYIARDSLTKVHVLAAFVKEWLSFACDTSVKNFGNFWLPLSYFLEPHLPNVNHCITVNLDLRFTGSLSFSLVRWLNFPEVFNLLINMSNKELEE